MKRIMLDTNTVSHLLKAQQRRAAERLMPPEKGCALGWVPSKLFCQNRGSRWFPAGDIGRVAALGEQIA